MSSPPAASVAEREIAAVGPDEPATSFPPYPPYEVAPAPPSVADTIIAGCDLRYTHKSTLPVRSAHPPPKPAGPRGPKATDVKLSKQAMRRHLRCMRTHGNVLTDRLEKISKPQRRRIINLWREYAEMLPPETIARIRAMLDADEPFKPDQAYQYFMNLRKTKKKTTANARIKELKKDLLAIYAEKRFEWARTATVAFAKGVQQRLSRPASCSLADGMLRLSDIILHEICGFMHMRRPSRRSNNPKAKFMMEIADKIAIWIDEILAESDDRMLMMDFDEDEDILGPGGDANFEDQFLDMMGDKGDKGGAGRGRANLLGPKPAYMMFTGPMREAFDILIAAMEKKGDEQLLKHGKFEQSYKEAANELLTTTDLRADDYHTGLLKQLKQDLDETSKPTTPANLTSHMADILDITSKYLSQMAEYNKDKGKAFQLMVKTMKDKSNSGNMLYQKDKIKATYGEAAKHLEAAKGLESDHDDPNLSQEIHSGLKKIMAGVNVGDLQQELDETMDVSSKYLSQKTVDDLERGPAFDILIEELEEDGAEPFCEFPALANKYAAAYTLKSAPGLTGIRPDPKTAPIFNELLHNAVDAATPKELEKDMRDVIDRCANYLSAFVRDRDIAKAKLLEMMKSNGKNVFATRPTYTMNYSTGAVEIETSPALIPYHPIKDIADEGKANLTRDMENKTPADLKIAMKALITDASRHLSQPFALRSGIAGPRYATEFLASVKKSLGNRPLFKYRAYGQSYADAATTLLHSGPITVTESELEKSAMNLHHQIKSEMTRGVPAQLAPTIAKELHPAMDEASRHLANLGTDKGKTLEHLVSMMKEKGQTPLAKLQGYEQTHDDGARRIEGAPTLTRNKVDKGAYEKVKDKLTTMTNEKPPLSEKHAQLMPEAIEMSSKYLSAPEPETQAEKRKVLGDLMGRAGDKIVGQEGAYKMTHIEGGAEVQKAKIGVTTAKDEGKRLAILGNIEAVIPDQKMAQMLKDPVQEGAAHLADTIKGRGEAMQIIEKSLKKEKDKELLKVGKFDSTHEGGGTMIAQAPNFTPPVQPAHILKEIVQKRVDDAVPSAKGSDDSIHMKDAKELSANYIAGIATKESGLTAEEIAKLEASGALSASAAPGRSGAGGSGETEEERKARLAREEEAKKKAGGETDAERKARLAREEEARKRAGAGGGGETDAERKARLAREEAEKKKAKGETEAERLARLAREEEERRKAAQNEEDMAFEKNKEALSRKAVIGGLQNQPDEILAQVNGKTETSFFAAQRLKKTKDFKTDNPIPEVADRLNEKMEDILNKHSMPRKLGPTVKEKTRTAADYLSTQVTKPDPYIKGYVALLEEMEAKSDKPLVQHVITMDHGEAAAYLRQLTSFDDEINMQNSAVKGDVTNKLKTLMADVTVDGCDKATTDKVIGDQAALLSSYAGLQSEKTDALKVLVGKMDEASKTMLLRHANVRKTFKDGADLLRGKTAEDLKGHEPADVVVVKKLDLKMKDLMQDAVPSKYQRVMPELMKEATDYLAVQIFEPRIIRICKCLRNASVQCELRGEESLRRVVKMPCTCSRKVSVPNILDLGPLSTMPCPGSSRTYPSGVSLSLKPCPSQNKKPCRADKPTSECKTAYVLHSATYERNYGDDQPTRIPPRTAQSPGSESLTPQESKAQGLSRSSTFQSLLKDIHYQNMQLYMPRDGTNTSPTSYSPTSFRSQGIDSPLYSQEPTIMSANYTRKSPSFTPTTFSKNYNAPTPISMSSEQMGDWHAMIVSLMWNIQAWRKWIEENIDRGLLHHHDPDCPLDKAENDWVTFQRRVSTEGLQWQQYNIFSRQLTTRLISRYSENSLSSIRSSEATLTDTYKECAAEMMEIIDMLHRWTQWLILVLKETGSLKLTADSATSLQIMRWTYYKTKMFEYSSDWVKYNQHVKLCWEQKYKNFLMDYVSGTLDSGPVWVVSACGAVPSGAVAAGVYDGEIIWIARTTHKSNVLPAALHPSKHCCLVYADGAVCHYTKYQVMCNAEVNWRPWRGGTVYHRAMRVAEGVYIGRLHYRDSHLVGPVYAPHYRCHVVIFGRPFAFNCYELLVLAEPSVA